MGSVDERGSALRLLGGLEDGVMPMADAVILADDLDPVLVYMIVSYLRAIYPASDPAASSVLERVVQLTTRSAALVKKFREGEKDPVSRWFESEYEYRDYRTRGPELIELIVDKLES
jgi:hypothetical protein